MKRLSGKRFFRWLGYIDGSSGNCNLARKPVKWPDWAKNSYKDGYNDGMYPN
jgi:hypothetical protein